MNKAGEPRLSVVIVNYRTPELTMQCLASLAREVEGTTGVEAVVVENGSGDQSAELISAGIGSSGWGHWCRLVVSGTNRGFAGGNNIGIGACRPSRYVLLLNSDTIVHSGALWASLAVMDAEPGVGVLSCKLLNRDGTVQNAARKFPNPIRITVSSTGLQRRWPGLFGWADCEDPGWDRGTVKRDVEWVGGAFMLIRSDLLRRIGALDEGFFFYGEDIEFCYRAWRSGARVHYDPSGAVTHLGGASSDPARMPAASRNRLAWEARYLVQQRCYGRWARWMVWGIDLVNLTIRTLVMRLRGHSGDPRCLEMVEALRLIAPGAGRPA